MFQVTPDSPGAACGIQTGDLILAVNGKDISAWRQKEASEEMQRAGNAFKLTIRRLVQKNPSVEKENDTIATVIHNANKMIRNALGIRGPKAGFEEM